MYRFILIYMDFDWFILLGHLVLGQLVLGEPQHWHHSYHQAWSSFPQHPHLHNWGLSLHPTIDFIFIFYRISDPPDPGIRKIHPTIEIYREEDLNALIRDLKWASCVVRRTKQTNTHKHADDPCDSESIYRFNKINASIPPSHDRDCLCFYGIFDPPDPGTRKKNDVHNKSIENWLV